MPAPKKCNMTDVTVKWSGDIDDAAEVTVQVDFWAKPDMNQLIADFGPDVEILSYEIIPYAVVEADEADAAAAAAKK